MNLLPIRRAGLRLALLASRTPPLAAVATVLCIGAAVAWAWWVPHARQAATQAEASLRRAVADARRNGARQEQALRNAPQTRLADFYAVLGDARRTELPLETLFALANANGLQLDKGEYKRNYDSQSRVYSYQALFPVKGSYVAIRRFCEAALRALPYASLDEIAFRREGVANGQLEGRLRFTFHLAETGQPNSVETRPERESATPAVDAAPGIVAMQEVRP